MPEMVVVACCTWDCRIMDIIVDYYSGNGLSDEFKRLAKCMGQYPFFLEENIYG
jgi:hypothetical protein